MIKIQNKTIGQNNKVFVIAEIGVNHCGNLILAKKMIDQAVKAGADAVKFQTFEAEKLVSPKTSKVKYQKKFTKKTKAIFK